MKLKNMTINNFLGIGPNQKVNFEDRLGLTLIEGINHDSPSSTSNGAGKSSIFEALYWVLFGTTKRGLKGDAVINEAVKKNCSVELTFETGSQEYTVLRSRKHKDFAAGLILTTGKNDLTKGTVKDTQELLSSIIKISPLTFSKIAYFGQGDIKPFASLTDKELKEVFEQSLGLTFFVDALKKVREQSKHVSSEVDRQSNAIVNAERDIDSSKEKIIYLSKAVKDIEDNASAEKTRIESELHALEVELNQIQAEIKNDSEKLTAVKLEAQPTIAELEKFDNLKNNANTKLDDLKRQLSNAKWKVGDLEQSLQKAIENIKKAKDKAGTDCDTCGREFTDGDIAKLQEQSASIAREFDTQLEEAKKQVQPAAEKVDKLLAMIAKLNEKIQHESEKCRAVDELEIQVNANYKNNSLRLSQVKSSLDSKQLALKNVKCDSKDYKTDIVKTEANLQKSEDICDKAREEIKTHEKRLKILTLLEKILGNDGLKSYVFDNVTPELNKHINENMQILDDISVEVSTVSKLKSGEYREKFSVKVNNQHGSSQYAGNSGGEQQKINLAIALAFNKVMRNMSSETLNIAFLDEPFESLDEGSSEKVIELCEQFASVGAVDIITHNQGVKDLIKNRIVVEKKDRKATIKQVA